MVRVYEDSAAYVNILVLSGISVSLLLSREFHMDNLLSNITPVTWEYVDSLGVLWEPLLYFQRPLRLNYLCL